MTPLSFFLGSLLLGVTALPCNNHMGCPWEFLQRERIGSWKHVRMQKDYLACLAEDRQMKIQKNSSQITEFVAARLGIHAFKKKNLFHLFPGVSLKFQPEN